MLKRFSSGKFHIKIVQKYGTGTVTGLYFIYFLECIRKVSYGIITSCTGKQ